MRVTPPLLTRPSATPSPPWQRHALLAGDVKLGDFGLAIKTAGRQLPSAASGERSPVGALRRSESAQADIDDDEMTGPSFTLSEQDLQAGIRKTSRLALRRRLALF